MAGRHTSTKPRELQEAGGRPLPSTCWSQELGTGRWGSEVRGTDPGPPGWGGGRAVRVVCWPPQEAAVPVWGPGHPLSWVPAPGGRGSPAEVSLAGAGSPSPARPGPAQHSRCRGLGRSAPPATTTGWGPISSLNLEATSSALETGSAVSQRPWGLSGIPSANARAVGGSGACHGVWLW